MMSSQDFRPMDERKHVSVDFTNQALIQDELLVSICLVLEHGWPAGPTFLHALSTLIESVVVHDAVYFDVLHDFQRGDEAPASLPGRLRNSDFVRALIRGEAIRPFPQESLVDAFLASKRRDYSYGHFLADAYWGTASFAYGEPEEEPNRLQLYVELVSEAQPLLLPQRLVPHGQRGAGLTIGGPELLTTTMLSHRLSLNQNDMKFIEGLNFRAKAFLDLARNTGLHLHPFYLGLPHQVGAIRHTNSKALELFRQVVEKANSLEPDENGIGDDEFSRMPIPPLLQVLLGRCKDSPKGFVTELLGLREDWRKFREYLTEYEKQWSSAGSKRERWKIKTEFEKALDLVHEREKRSSTRIIYTLWDFFKEPTKVLKTFGDKLSKRGREEYIIGRVKGLHDFWEDLAESPTSDNVRRQFNKIFPKQADESTWTLGKRLAETVNAGLIGKPG